MSKFFVLIVVLLVGCDVTLPPACTLLAGTTLCPSDSGVAGEAGTHSHTAGVGGVSGAGVGSAGSGGTGDAGHAGSAGSGGASGAGAGGLGGAGAAGHDHGGSGGTHSGHGGLPVTLPLPAAQPGSKTFDVRYTGEMPAPDAGGIGAARTVCEFSHANFDDAILYPGQFGRAHAHTYAGADKVDANGIAPDAGGTCRGGTANLSAYWWPSLLRPDGRVVVPVESHHYLKSSHYDTDGPVQHLPKGLRVIAGDMNARGPTQNQFYFHWSCVDNGSIQSATIPDCGGGQISMDVSFPQCWNGQLSSADGKSHMSYPVNGRCPSSHPTKIPSYSYHIRYAPCPGCRLSCDSATGPGGYCIHADLITGWDQAVVDSMVDSCVNTGLSCGSHMIGGGRVLF